VAKPKIEPIRWTVNQVVLEFGVTGNKFTSGCRACGIEAGKDGKYSTREVNEALNGSNGLERKSKEARWTMQIDEAQFTKNKRLEQDKRLVDTSKVEKAFEDLVATYVAAIRRSKLSETDKHTAIKQLGEVKLSF
jgi:hypothetical protein